MPDGLAPSALKHGLGEDEILHAYRNPVRVIVSDISVGPSRDSDPEATEAAPSVVQFGVE